MLPTLIATLALAGTGPHQCEAVFAGPAESCSLRGEWTVSATAKSEDKAKKAAEAKLAETVRLATLVRIDQTRGSMAELEAASDQRGCPKAVAERARVFCTPKPELADKKLCFASVEAPDRYRGLASEVSGPGWKVAELGREAICAEVDRTLEARDASDAERRACQLACVQNTQVRCIDP